MDSYIITQIDAINNLVYATLTYQGNTLNDRFPVDDVTDSVEITQACENAFNNFQISIDSQANIPTLPAEVIALIDQPVDAGTFNTAVSNSEQTLGVKG